MEFRQTYVVFLYLLTGCLSYNIKRQAWITPDDGCKTPDRKSGYCIPDHLCKSKSQFLAERVTLNDREEKALTLYSCGSNKNDQKTCCPQENFNLDWLEGDCKTPDKSIGRCIPISSCQPMLDFITKHDNIGSAAQQALRQYLCGASTGGSKDYKVCCPSKPIELETRTIEKDLHLKDHSSHKNAHLLPPDCGHFSSDGKIIGGKAAALFEFPWIAALKYQINDRIEFNCGGSLISSRYILTAGHCIQPTLVGVRLGEHNFTTDVDCEIGNDGNPICAPPHQDFPISSVDITLHPQFKSKPLENDIALIRLRTEVNFAPESVRPICLPLTSNEKVSKIRSYTVIGWGTTGSERNSKVLLKTEVKTRDNSRCAIERSMYSRKLCAGGENEMDACQGDSGGPLMSEYIETGQIKSIQYGIVSYGPSICGRENSPTTYTSIPAYVEWILNNLRR